MSQDSLGKKTHLPSVLKIFNYADVVWPLKKPIDLRDAAHTLGANLKVKALFAQDKLSFDPRAQQAYVKRFFKWLELPKDLKHDYPTLILSAGDSLALRQCLYLDFIFNTSEAPEAISGLNAVLRKKDQKAFELSPTTHSTFCRWIGVKDSDNTRRGPFARWLEDAALAARLPERGRNERSIIISLNDERVVTPEALTYGLFLEFCEPFETPFRKPRQITLAQVRASETVKALLLKDGAIDKILLAAGNAGYVSLASATISLDPKAFVSSLKKRVPLPSPGWLPDHDITTSDPVRPELAAELAGMPADDCTSESGSPLESNVELRATDRQERIREKAFNDRVSAAYRNTCVVSGLKFRAPLARRRFFGNAAHIVPHSGENLNGEKVYGKSVVANGIFLDSFWHWCFDQGWIGLEPVRTKGVLQSYRFRVATIALDDAFSTEWKLLKDYDNQRVRLDRLPDRKELWPSIEALDWHRSNIFADCRL